MAANFLSPGTKVIQKRNGPLVIPGVPSAISGFLVAAQKGPVGVPVLLSNPDDYERVFGGAVSGSRGKASTDAFWNEGGKGCYVVRYIGAGSASAVRHLTTTGGATAGSHTSNPSTPFPTPTLFDGATITGTVDGGAPHTATFHATRAQVTGSGATYAAVTAGHHMIVGFNRSGGNGGAAETVTFDGTENTQAKYIAKINSQLQYGRVQDNGAGQLTFISDVAGSHSGGTLLFDAGNTSADVPAALGFAAAVIPLVNAGPNNVADIGEVTAAEFVTIVGAAFTGSTLTANQDGTITWTSNTTGPSSSVQFTGGTWSPTNVGWNTLIHSGSSSATIGTIDLTASSPGAWANAGGYLLGVSATQVNTVVTKAATIAAGSTTTIPLASTARVNIGDTLSIVKGGDTQRGVVAQVNGNNVVFSAAITVPSGGYDGTQSVTLETFNINVYKSDGSIVNTWTGLRMSPLAGSNYFVNAINGTAFRNVNAADLTAAAADPRPSTDTNPVALSGGSDGSAPVANDVIGSATVPKTGVYAFDGAPDVSFISCPGAATDFAGAGGLSIIHALESYVSSRDMVMAIHDLPRGTPPTGGGGVRDWLQNTANLVLSNESCYWPWVKKLDDNGVVTLYPPSPHVMGIIARIHAARNFGAAPAGTDAALTDILDLEYSIKEQSPEYDDFYPAGGNAIINFPGNGFLIWGSKTMDPTGEFGEINVQIVFNVVKRAVKIGTRFANFQPNDATLRASIVRVLTSYFRGLRTSRILTGAKDSDAFYIICDETNNTDGSNRLTCRIGLAVTEPAVFIEEDLELKQ